MDLRGYTLSADERKQFEQFIIDRKLAYQPFVLADDLEVGEGLAFVQSESDRYRKGTVWWPSGPSELDHIKVEDRDLSAFRAANQQLRGIYDHMIDFIIRNLPRDINRNDFAEFGCNTGYFVHSLSQKGANRTVGLDFTPNSDVFSLFNRILNTRSEFIFSEWDSWRHTCRYGAVPMVDVVLSIAVTCHLPDPLHHLTYLANAARSAMFVWIPVNENAGLNISYGKPNILHNDLSWPITFDNNILLSRELAELTLWECGFRRLKILNPPQTDMGVWNGIFNSHVGMLAIRTEDPKTVYNAGEVRRKFPGTAILPDESAFPFLRDAPPRALFRTMTDRVFHYQGEFFAVPLSEAHPAELIKRSVTKQSVVLCAPDLEVLVERMEARNRGQSQSGIAERNYDPPRLLSSTKFHNIVKYQNDYICIPFSLGQVDVAVDPFREMEGIFVAGTEQVAVDWVKKAENKLGEG